jgi:hypothetical protein
MCSQQYFNLPARPVRSHGGGFGRTSQLAADFLLDTFTRFRRKVVGTSQPASSLKQLTLEELVFLCCEYYSIFLLQQEEASAL